MKKIILLISVLLVIGMLLTLTACGDKKSAPPFGENASENAEASEDAANGKEVQEQGSASDKNDKGSKSENTKEETPSDPAQNGEKNDDPQSGSTPQSGSDPQSGNPQQGGQSGDQPGGSSDTPTQPQDDEDIGEIVLPEDVFD